MSAETALQIISIANQQGANALAAMDRNITLQLNATRAANQDVTNIRLKAMQFAEETRMNDARMTEMASANQLRAKEADLNAQLAPIKLEAAKIQLETARVTATRINQENSMKNFNMIVEPWNQRMGIEVSSKQNPDQAKAYLAYTGNWAARVASGESFDAAEFEDGLRKINEPYAAVTPAEPDGWNPEVDAMLSIFSPNTQKQYAMRNPKMKANTNLLMSSYITAGDTAAAGIASKFTDVVPPDKLGQASIYREAYQQNARRIEGLDMAISKQQAIVNTADRADRAPLESQLKEMIADRNTREQQNRNIIANINAGRYENALTDQTPTEAAEPVKPKHDLEGDSGKPSIIMGVRDDATTNKFVSRLQKVASIFATGNSTVDEDVIANSPLRDVNMAWFAENLKSEQPDDGSLNRIKNRVRNAIDQQGIDGRFEKQPVDALFKTMDTEIEVPISPWLKEQIMEHVPKWQKVLGMQGDPGFVRAGEKLESVLGAPSSAVNKIRFSSQKDFTSEDWFTNKDGLASFSAMEQMISAIPGKEAREEAKRELFSALTAAAVASAASRR